MDEVLYNLEHNGHKCFCGKWLCETPEELECVTCKEEREKGPYYYGLCRPMGSMLLLAKCVNCRETVSMEYTPEGSSV